MVGRLRMGRQTGRGGGGGRGHVPGMSSGRATGTTGRPDVHVGAPGPGIKERGLPLATAPVLARCTPVAPAEATPPRRCGAAVRVAAAPRATAPQGPPLTIQATIGVCVLPPLPPPCPPHGAAMPPPAARRPWTDDSWRRRRGRVYWQTEGKDKGAGGRAGAGGQCAACAPGGAQSTSKANAWGSG